MNRIFFSLCIIVVMAISLGSLTEGRTAQKEQTKKLSQSSKSPSASHWDTVLQAAKGEGTLIVYTLSLIHI